MLQVVHVKSENQKLHRCHVCGKIDVWRKDWMSRMIPIGTGYKGYEIDFNSCSEHCRDLTKDISNKQFLMLYNRNK